MSVVAHQREENRSVYSAPLTHSSRVRVTVFHDLRSTVIEILDDAGRPISTASVQSFELRECAETLFAAAEQAETKAR